MIISMLSFAGGVMTGVVLFGLVPEAVALSGIKDSVYGIVLGFISIMIMNRFADCFLTAAEKNKRANFTYDGLQIKNKLPLNRKALLRSGLIMLAAISIHNLPEGMAIGAGGSHNVQLGALLALMIALHDIPEGMSIAAPLISGGMNKSKAVVLTAVSGTATLIGGIIGAVLGNISDNAIALSLSAAGGAMLYVVFGEIIPQLAAMSKNRIPAIEAVAGVITGFIISGI